MEGGGGIVFPSRGGARVFAGGGAKCLLLSTAPPLKKSLGGGGGETPTHMGIHISSPLRRWADKQKINAIAPPPPDSAPVPIHMPYSMVSQIRYITIPSLLPLLPQYSYLKTKTKINFLIHTQYVSPRISNKSLYTVRGGFPTPCRKIFG